MSNLPTEPAPANPAARFRSPPWDQRHPDWLAIDQRLPPDHLVRRLDHASDQLDLDAFERLYAGRGELAWPPRLLLRAALYFLQRGLTSPACWAEEARFDDRARWLLRGCQPSRSAWYAFRDRLSAGIDAMNNALVLLAVAAGLTTAEQGALDGTSMAAYGSRHRLLNRDGLQKRLDQLSAALAADARATPATDQPDAGRTAAAEPTPPPTRPDAATDQTAVGAAIRSPATTEPATTEPATTEPARAPSWLARTARGRQRQARSLSEAQRELDRRLQRNADKRSEKRTPIKNVRICPSEPDAAVGRDKEKVFRAFYNVQLVADLHTPLILGYAILNQPNDAGVLGPMLRQLQQQQIPLRDILVDSAYTGGADLAAAEAAGVTVYGPPAGTAVPGKKGKPPAYLPKSSFSWDASRAVYVCPAGQELSHTGTTRQKQSSVELVVLEHYQAAAGVCGSCPLSSGCTPNPERGRSVSRSQYEPAVERLSSRMQARGSVGLYRRRSATVERLNADVKEHRGLRRLPSRGVRGARVVVGLAVLGHNLLVVEAARRTEPPIPTATPPPEQQNST